MPPKTAPPKKRAREQGPDFTDVLALLAQQKTETTQALMSVLKTQGESAAADRKEFKDALTVLTTSTQDHTLAIRDLKNTLDKKDISCDAHSAELLALRKEVTGVGPEDTCSAKSRIQRLETKHDNLDAAFKGFRTHHNDDADAFRKEVRASIERLNGVQTTAVTTGASWVIKALWGAVGLLVMVIIWMGGLYYTNVIQPALQAHNNPSTLVKP